MKDRYFFILKRPNRQSFTIVSFSADSLESATKQADDHASTFYRVHKYIGKNLSADQVRKAYL